MIKKYLAIASILRVALSVISQCTTTEVKSLLEGCDRLIGLNVTSVGGTMVNDHNCDVLLPKQVFLEEPLFQYNLADSKRFYTLIMVDPDVPPQLEGEFYLHMVKSNIPGLALKAKESSKTVGIDYRVSDRRFGFGHSFGFGQYNMAETLVQPNLYIRELSYVFRLTSAYKPPAPPRGSGQHRYVILLYEQADGNNFLPTVPSTRHRFTLAKWLLGKNLCGPVAGIEFKCEY